MISFRIRFQVVITRYILYSVGSEKTRALGGTCRIDLRAIVSGFPVVEESSFHSGTIFAMLQILCKNKE